MTDEEKPEETQPVAQMESEKDKEPTERISRFSRIWDFFKKKKDDKKFFLKVGIGIGVILLVIIIIIVVAAVVPKGGDDPEVEVLVSSSQSSTTFKVCHWIHFSYMEGWGEDDCSK